MISLVIMAAGLGSRFKGEIKQLAPLGPNGEVLMDYSVLAAKEAGFEQVIFIIRKDLLKDFQERVGNRIEKLLPCQYVFQDLYDIPKGFEVKNRTKPWGTGHAILEASSVITGPFAVINADDYYGKKSFQLLYQYLSSHRGKYDYAMIGYPILKTLSENGGVSRGICKQNEKGELMSLQECHEVCYRDGKIFAKEQNDISLDTIVSMNFFGFQPSILEELKEQFQTFLETLEPGDITSEFLLPQVVAKLISDQKATVKVLKTEEECFGVTYREDSAQVKEKLKQYTKQ